MITEKQYSMIMNSAFLQQACSSLSNVMLEGEAGEKLKQAYKSISELSRDEFTKVCEQNMIKGEL